MDNIGGSAALMDEGISILSTTWLPSPEDANAIKSRTIVRREMIKEIDEEIAVLQARRHALVMACDIGRAIMAPIRKLPVELLTKIFIKCIPPLQTKSSRRRRSQMHPQDVGELLGSVCRAWHTIVNDDPRIWSTLVLDREIQAPEDVDLLLKKSGSHPLDIFIEPCFWFPTGGQQVPDYNGIFAMLRSELWRTRSFIADMRSSEGAVSGAFFPQGFSINAPMMQTFTHIRDSLTPAEHDLDTFHGPRLCSIILQYSENLVRSMVANPVQTVRHLEVGFSHGPTALYLHLLSALPNLVSLHWKGKDETEQVQEAPSSVVLHSLKSLRLHAAGSAMYLLSFLHAPSLESLELLHASETVSIVQALCGDGVVKLHHLHLFECFAFESGPDVWAASMLGQLDCLETLIIEHSDMLYDLLTALSPQDRDFSSVCPQLTTLVISKSDIPLGPFVDFVHRRTRADWEEAVPGLVTSLKLSDNDSGRWHGGSSSGLCRHFAQSHSATVRFMSKDEYQDTSLAYILQDDKHDRWGWDEVGQGWGPPAGT